jgi:hypothetical protein
MGYSTEFEGGFKVDRPLSFEHYGVLKMLHDDQDEVIKEYKMEAPTDAYCQWKVQSDRQTIKWDGGEKFYDYDKWIENICMLLETWGYKLNGTVLWQGEDMLDRGKIVVTDNSVRLVKFATEEELNKLAKSVVLHLLDNQPKEAMEAAEKWRSLAHV